MSRAVGWVLVVALAIVVGFAVPTWARGTTERVSVATGGARGNSSSFNPAISADGRFVAFVSIATNLAPGDTNNQRDVFVHDRWTGKTRRVSVGSGGVQANGNSDAPAISPDGRFVTFHSDAGNLVPGDTGFFDFDVFVHDRWTGKTRRVSVGPRGVEGNGHSWNPAVSAHGRFVAFSSDVTNLVRGDTNGEEDVFVHDRRTGTIRRVNIGSGGVQANGISCCPAISADGRFVAFDSFATNLVPGDTNGRFDVFVRDRVWGITRRVSVRTGGAQARGSDFNAIPAISGNGRFVGFTSTAANLVPGDTNRSLDVFVHDQGLITTGRVSMGRGGVQGNSGSRGGGLSANGRFVTFDSFATNLVPGDTNGWPDIFVRDRKTNTILRASVGPGGAQANGVSQEPAISADGRFVAFSSDATNLVPGDTNGAGDVFVRTLVGD